MSKTKQSIFNFLSGQILKELVIQWSKVAYENIPYKGPDYEMDDDGKPRLINQGMSMLEHKFTDLMQGDISEDSIALHIDYSFQQWFIYFVING